ncbi:MAG: hypothetical protein MI923_09110 [Phycisphaerales bacterium]|nr:hypothetical protein [Phycisphaerales bacterium]
MHASPGLYARGTPTSHLNASSPSPPLPHGRCYDHTLRREGEDMVRTNTRAASVETRPLIRGEIEFSKENGRQPHACPTARPGSETVLSSPPGPP